MLNNIHNNGAPVQRKTKNTKNLTILTTASDQQNGSSSASSSSSSTSNSPQSNQNLSPIPYSPHLPSPITPTTSCKCFAQWLRQQKLIEFLVLVSNMQSATLLPPLSSAPSVITTSTMSQMHHNLHFPTLQQMPTINSHLYQQSSMMNVELNQACNFSNVLDIIKMENGAHNNYARSLVVDSGEKNNNNKLLDLEVKHRPTLTNN